MKRTYIAITAGLACQSLSFAQNPPEGAVYRPMVTQLQQQAETLETVRRNVLENVALRSEPGKPFSATVTTKTTQTFLDGTRVNQTTTVNQYRDAEGRIRTETTRSGEPAGRVNIVIRDPVEGVSFNLDTVNKTANKIAIPGGAYSGSYALGVGGGGGTLGARGGTAASTPGGAGGGGGRMGRGRGGMSDASVDGPSEAARTNPNNIVDDLGLQSINGVSARGTRITTVVPVGAIGNDKEFRSVTERWFSPELNMLVKSVSTDPRFGTTTYEVTSISRANPEPSLFRPPADFTITTNMPVMTRPTEKK